MASSSAAESGSSSGGGGDKMVVLISSDGEHFELTEAAASMSQTVLFMIEDGCIDPAGIRLLNVDARMLAKVVSYCSKHAAEAAAEEAVSTSENVDDAGKKKRRADEAEDLKRFDDMLVDVDSTTLFNLVMAANYMEVKGLLDLACQRVADMMVGKMPEEIREMFGIENDFTPEEAAAVREENAWAFDNN